MAQGGGTGCCVSDRVMAGAGPSLAANTRERRTQRENGTRERCRRGRKVTARRLQTTVITTALGALGAVRMFHRRSARGFQVTLARTRRRDPGRQDRLGCLRGLHLCQNQIERCTRPPAASRRHGVFSQRGGEGEEGVEMRIERGNVRTAARGRLSAVDVQEVMCVVQRSRGILDPTATPNEGMG